MMASFNIKSTIGDGYNMNLDDVMSVKTILNSLGYYDVPKYGMTVYPDQQMIVGIKSYQHDNGLTVDGYMKHSGETVKSMNRNSSEGSDVKTQAYIWRTKSDNKVRSSHAEREGKIFSWDNPPEGGHPGEAYNCRCEAEPVGSENECQVLYVRIKNLKESLKLVIDRLEKLNAESIALVKEIEKLRQKRKPQIGKVIAGCIGGAFTGAKRGVSGAVSGCASSVVTDVHDISKINQAIDKIIKEMTIIENLRKIAYKRYEKINTELLEAIEKYNKNNCSVYFPDGT
ncbi:MAG: minor capsid protein [Alphaproteobacteria bacterium]|nr:minor capsid protein [Alphaproteobacteria bacterium]